MLGELNVLNSSGANWEGEQHGSERTVSWTERECGALEVFETIQTFDSYRYGQGEQTVWCDGDTLNRLTVEVQTTVTLERVRVSELSPLELELEGLRSRLCESRCKTHQLRDLMACWDE